MMESCWANWGDKMYVGPYGGWTVRMVRLVRLVGMVRMVRIIWMKRQT